MATILVVDDEQIDREIIRRVVQREGHNVLEAGNYAQAVEIFRGQAGDIDVLVVDVTLPGKNGCELGKYLRSLRMDLAILSSERKSPFPAETL